MMGNDTVLDSTNVPGIDAAKAMGEKLAEKYDSLNSEGVVGVCVYAYEVAYKQMRLNDYKNYCPMYATVKDGDKVYIGINGRGFEVSDKADKEVLKELKKTLNWLIAEGKGAGYDDAQEDYHQRLLKAIKQ